MSRHVTGYTAEEDASRGACLKFMVFLLSK